MQTIRKGDFITTLTGKQFYPLSPDPSQIDVRDIAWALSMQCRYAGHIYRFYSVAEHSVHVSRVCAPEDARWGLMHDAAEAYIQDIIKPLKVHLSEYQVIEMLWESCITEAFGLSRPRPEGIKSADCALYALEVQSLRPIINGIHGSIVPMVEPANVVLQCWNPQQACDQFLDRFTELFPAQS